jgi:penicillin-insensitive murein endopeptidase
MPNIPVNGKLYSKVKSQAKKKFKVWPSAYASGWLVKNYKKLGGKYKVSPKRKSPKRKSRSRNSPKRKLPKCKSPKRKSRSRNSLKRKSPKRKSPKRKSPKRKSPKRKSPKRKSPKRKSPKRKSPKRKSPKRKSPKTGLSRWFQEEWIDVCKLPKIVPCGRKNSRNSKRSYPYCRPRYKITSKSPKTAKSLSLKEIRKRCIQKRRSPYKKVMA